MTLKVPTQLKPPLCICGFTAEGNPVIGGAFQMADTYGFPLCFSLDEADKNKWVISIPHYFSSAMEAGWDDIQTFGKIQEAFADRGSARSFEMIKYACIAMFMSAAKEMPDKPATEVGRRMRLWIESDKMAKAAEEKIG